jgi:hypothetical protein
LASGVDVEFPARGLSSGGPSDRNETANAMRFTVAFPAVAGFAAATVVVYVLVEATRGRQEENAVAVHEAARWKSPTLPVGLRAHLIEIDRDDIRGLDRLVGRALSVWLQT